MRRVSSARTPPVRIVRTRAAERRGPQAQPMRSERHAQQTQTQRARTAPMPGPALPMPGPGTPDEPRPTSHEQPSQPPAGRRRPPGTGSRCSRRRPPRPAKGGYRQDQWSRPTTPKGCPARRQDDDARRRTPERATASGTRRSSRRRRPLRLRTPRSEPFPRTARTAPRTARARRGRQRGPVGKRGPPGPRHGSRPACRPSDPRDAPRWNPRNALMPSSRPMRRSPSGTPSASTAPYRWGGSAPRREAGR